MASFRNGRQTSGPRFHIRPSPGVEKHPIALRRIDENAHAHASFLEPSEVYLENPIEIGHSRHNHMADSREPRAAQGDIADRVVVIDQSRAPEPTAIQPVQRADLAPAFLVLLARLLHFRRRGIEPRLGQQRR